MTPDLTFELTAASFNYAEHGVAELAKNRFEDEAAFYRSAAEFSGVLLLQTCGRIEILVHGARKALEDFLVREGRCGFIFFEGTDVLRHLGNLAAGTESLIVGEDQILGQMKTALLAAEKYGGADSVISSAFQTAINLGVYVRQNTAINRGAVSLGSAAVSLAEAEIGDLSGKNILVVGGGEMGRLVAKSLAEKNLRAIYVTNRTYENAVQIASDVGGRAMHLDQLYPCIALSDVVISCTAAPHEIIRKDALAEVMEDRFWPLDAAPRKLLLIDIANPPDIEAGCGDLAGVTLCGIDDLKGISFENMQSRLHEAEEAQHIVEAYIPEFIKTLNRTAAGDVLASLYSWAEEIRRRELVRAAKKLASGADAYSLIEDVTASITKKMLDDAAKVIRKSAEEQSPETARNIVAAITRRH
ncbi:MAG TPA: glutamyl-tRNA reductase [Methanocorpusculum sp.]|nr:glutamyl-tRNA reductase [Methanocorpusculum sp.]